MARTRWTNRLLDEMRQAGDPAADAVVQELFETDRIDAVNGLMQTLVRNDDVPRAKLPKVVRSYLDSTDDLPGWADPRRIALGEEFFGVHGPAIVMAFACASLPKCYACRKGVQVLHLTARLQSDPVRRIAETAQLILNVMAPGGLGPGGRGIRDAQKVRLMHAAVRHLCVRSDQWDADWDTPGNQEDLAMTLCTFSIVPLQALGQLGTTIGEDEAEAYLHAWNVVGHVLGIDRRLLAQDVEHAEQLWSAITRRQWDPSEAGRAMTQALIEAMEHRTPGTVFDGCPAQMVRFLCGDELADMLGVDSRDWSSLLNGPLRLFASHSDAVADHVPFAGRISAHFSHQLLEGLTWVSRGGDRAPFSIPPGLAERWDVRTADRILG
jgi:hypothetical protein